MTLNVSWIRGSNALSLLRDRLAPKLVEHKQKLSRSSCAVFIPVCHREEKLNLLYTKRTETLNSHTGQISFPGGRCEEGETARETSIREMEEEIGVAPSQVWGSLSRPVVSLKMENVYGCVGYIGHLEDLQLKLSPDEVSHVFTVPIEELVHSRFEQNYTNQRSRRQWEMLADRVESDSDSPQDRVENIRRISQINEYRMPVFPSPIDTDPDIWGLTAVMTDRLLYTAFKKNGYKKHDFTPSPE